MAAPKGNAVVAQSGGPTAVINASLVGVIEECQKHAEIENIYGAIHAVAGMDKNDFVDLTGLDSDTLELVASTPSSSIATRKRSAAIRVYSSSCVSERWYFPSLVMWTFSESSRGMKPSFCRSRGNNFLGNGHRRRPQLQVCTQVAAKVDHRTAIR